MQCFAMPGSRPELRKWVVCSFYPPGGLTGALTRRPATHSRAAAQSRRPAARLRTEDAQVGPRSGRSGRPARSPPPETLQSRVTVCLLPSGLHLSLTELCLNGPASRYARWGVLPIPVVAQVLIASRVALAIVAWNPPQTRTVQWLPNGLVRSWDWAGMCARHIPRGAYAIYAPRRCLAHGVCAIHTPAGDVCNIRPEWGVCKTRPAGPDPRKAQPRVALWQAAGVVFGRVGLRVVLGCVGLRIDIE